MNAVSHLTAIQYRHTFSSGHSRPCLVEAETLEGERHEVVVKLGTDIQGHRAGLARELVASHFASALGLKTPTPYIVEITPEFAESVVQPDVRRRFSENLGLQYGGEYLSGAWHAVPFSPRLPHKLVDPAAATLAFDAILRNDDRHVEKSNYLIRDSQIALIDHERAFPSALAGSEPLPWEPGGLEFLRRHVFFAGLRGQLPDFEPVPAAFETLSDDELSAMVASIPDSWDRGGVAAGISGYLVALRANFRNVMTSLRTLLQ